MSRSSSPPFLTHAIRWKQRDIHEKREKRKLNIAKLNTELSLNAVLRPRITTVLEGLETKGVSHFRSVQRRLREQPSDEKPDTGHPDQPTYDMMMSQLLGDVFRESAWIVDGAATLGAGGKVTKDGKKIDEKAGQPSWTDGEIPDSKLEPLAAALKERLEWHIKDLGRRDTEIRKELEEEKKAQKGKITSDDIRDGWSKTAVSASKPSPLDDKPKMPKKKQETIEVLNPGASSVSRPDHALCVADARSPRHQRLRLTQSPRRMSTSARFLPQPVPLPTFPLATLRNPSTISRTTRRSSRRRRTTRYSWKHLTRREGEKRGWPRDASISLYWSTTVANSDEMA